MMIDSKIVAKKQDSPLAITGYIAIKSSLPKKKKNKKTNIKKTKNKNKKNLFEVLSQILISIAYTWNFLVHLWTSLLLPLYTKTSVGM